MLDLVNPGRPRGQLSRECGPAASSRPQNTEPTIPSSPGAALNRTAQKEEAGLLPATGFAMGCYTKECSANEIAYLKST